MTRSCVVTIAINIAPTDDPRDYDVVVKHQDERVRDSERCFILQQIDTLWREHLQAMDALRESVGLRGYGQKDPLIEYKNEGYYMFLDMMTNMRRNVIYSMFMFQPAPAASTTA